MFPTNTDLDGGFDIFATGDAVSGFCKMRCIGQRVKDSLQQEGLQECEARDHLLVTFKVQERGRNGTEVFGKVFLAILIWLHFSSYAQYSFQTYALLPRGRWCSCCDGGRTWMLRLDLIWR
jgi:hypothetical protein